ncbi:MULTISPECIES: alcohol dehydrogenase catalytic domain-containing protein [unclassified Paenibacillus]|uniref:zinc-dependent alcohol dehydrogenase n=1 Tax=unclassified Paenibacillus TaxID=185978 RepID=UPI001AE61A92|nr:MULTISPECIES: alcohol dehydrogenase catalytic domain-containing protein [unclassified Paenibacillus]MBP1153616.1 2-desacetyl-2-hydroxyethyl bacteriochlorophyllide A dehydrogenase [Paenibacillus sp. PvP091]MBP1170999.1 2-desacetyl-2-hydroxyethyl bacteriochlorophyllide A dehydrogenase [Paenibacillus sp. PvR098]MBP2442027.1 2-desacetyl-2-hydroxyethyl bacteriochlorophyllide A dehydrogenase [Paenibacillus sp. PvP052]
MKATFYEGNRQIRMGECIPVPPGMGEVQIKVSHAGICGTDLHIYHGHMDKRVSFPQTMGHEMSGVIQELGEGVTDYAIGDRVTVMPLSPCGQCPACSAGHSHICQNLRFLGIETPGAFQSSWTVPAYTLHRLPDSLSLEHGAMIEPLAVACHDVRRGEVQNGEYAVVLGGGPIGMLIALVAREAGAKVLISEINPFRLELARELGLDTINPKETNIVDYVNQQTGGAGADVVFEVTSSAAGAEVMTQLPRTRGRIVVVGIFPQPPKVDLHRFFWRELQMSGARVYEHEDFEKAIQLSALGKLPLDRLITEVYPLERLEEGFKQMESGGSVMKILLRCS